MKEPNITIEQLADELTGPEQLERAPDAPGDTAGQSQADVVLSQFSQKLMQILRKAGKQAEHKPQLKQRLDELQSLGGIEPSKLHQHIHQLWPTQAAQFMRQHQGLMNQVLEVRDQTGQSRLGVPFPSSASSVDCMSPVEMPFK